MNDLREFLSVERCVRDTGRYDPTTRLSCDVAVLDEREVYYRIVRDGQPVTGGGPWGNDLVFVDSCPGLIYFARGRDLTHFLRYVPWDLTTVKIIRCLVDGDRAETREPLEVAFKRNQALRIELLGELTLTQREYQDYGGL